MKIARKVYMSIFTSVFIFITSIATTFAWVGMLTTSTLGSFDLYLKSYNNVKADYYLKISSTDDTNNKNYDVSINSNDIKRQILENMGVSTAEIYDDGIEGWFNDHSAMEPVTTDKDLSGFYSITGLNEGTPYLVSDKRFFKFDFYIIAEPKEGLEGMSSEEKEALNINANVFFENITQALKNDINETVAGNLVNLNPFSSMPSSSGNYELLRDIKSSLSIRPLNSTRLAIQTYDPINVTDTYTGTEMPNNTIIFQGGKQLPSVTNGVYDLGGIVPEKYNLALKEINSIFKTNVDTNNLCIKDETSPFLGAYDRIYNNYIYIDSSSVNSNNYNDFYLINPTLYTNYNVGDAITEQLYVINNNDYILTSDTNFVSGTDYYSITYSVPSTYDSNEKYYTIEYMSTDLEMVDENNNLWKSPSVVDINSYNYLGMQSGEQTKMKFTIYFWYEGFDADCLSLIDRQSTVLSLVLATDRIES